MSWKHCVAASWVVACTACGGSATTDGGVTSAPPPSASKLFIRVNPSGTRTGVALQTQPVIEVQDAQGRIVTGGTVPVTAVIGSGGGALAGTATVNSQGGVATFTDLVVNGASGQRTLAFSAPGLPTATSQAFSLTAPVLTQLKTLTAPSSTASTLIPLANQPVVQLLDELGQPYPVSTPVNATILQGHAIVASGTTAVSTPDGKATFSGLALGANNGVAGIATLRLTAGSLPPLDFTVTLSCSTQPLALGATATGTLANGDCMFGGGNLVGYYERTFTSSSPALQGVIVNASSTAFVPDACIRGPISGWTWCLSGTSSQASVKAIVNAAPFYPAVTTDSAGRTGAFTIATTSASSDIANCDYVLVMFTGSTSQTLSNTDCQYPASNPSYPSARYDRFIVPLAHSEGIIVTVNAAFPLYAAIIVNDTVVSASSGFQAQVSYNNGTQAPRWAEVRVNALAGGQLGAYTLATAMQYPSAERAPVGLRADFPGFNGGAGEAKRISVMHLRPGGPGHPPPTH